MTSAELLELSERLARALAGEGGREAVLRAIDSRGGGVLLLNAGGALLASSTSKDLKPPQTLPSEAGEVRLDERTSALALRSPTAPLGWLLAFGAKERRPSEAALRIAGALLSVDLATEAMRRESRPEEVWQRLLAGEFTESGSAMEAARAMGITLASHYLVVALAMPDVEHALPFEELRAHVLACIGGSDVLCTRSGATLLLLCPAPTEPEAAKQRVGATLLPKSVARRAPDIQLLGGIGTRQSLHSIAQSARQAQRALDVVRRIHGVGNVMPYEALGAYPLLFEEADDPRWVAFSQAYLQPIRDYDTRHQTELERTMTTYFACGENVKIASERLYVHRHTVFYRLRQIAEITGLSFESAHDQLHLRLAVTIDALRA